MPSSDQPSAVLADIQERFGSRGHSRGCPICGERNTTAVMVGLNQLGKNGTNTPSRIGSKMVSFCEKHGAELFLRLVGELEAKAVR